MRPTRGVYERPTESGTFWIEWYDCAGRRHREKAGTRSAAAALYLKRKAQTLLERKLPEIARRRTVRFSELIEDMLAYSRLHKRSYRDDLSRQKKLTAWWGARLVDSLTPSEIELRLAEEFLSPATSNRYLSLISLAYRLGLRSGKAQSNPVRLVRRRKGEEARRRFLSLEEEARLRLAISEHCPEHLSELEISLNTGMRQGEQYRLLWSDVDLQRGTVSIARSKFETGRYIPLNAPALSAFEGLHQRAHGDRVFLIKRPRGWFTGTLSLAQIHDFTWHDLRHTFASRLVMSGVHLKVVQELMGHKSILITARYAHLAPGYHSDAVESLSGFAGRTEAYLAATQTATWPFHRA